MMESTDLIGRQRLKYFHGFIEIIYHFLLGVIFIIATGLQRANTRAYY